MTETVTRTANKITAEPAMLWMAVIAPLIQLVSAFVLPLNTDQQGVLNGLAAAIVGIIVAVAVDVHKALPLLTGLAQAVISVGLAFGLHLAPEAQGALLALVAAVVALFGVRPQVTVKRFS